MSESDRHRERGNEIFKSVTTGLSPVVQQMRLKEAWNWYKSALECSSTAQEKASARKNLAMASWKLASLGKDEEAKILVYFQDAMKNFGKALEVKSGANKSAIWVDNLVQDMYQCLLESIEFVDNNELGERSATIFRACTFPDGELRADVSLLYVERLLKKSIQSFNEGNFTESKSVLGNCYQPLEIGRIYGAKKKQLMEKFKKLNSDVTRQTAVVEARQALKAGDDLKEIVLEAKDYNSEKAFEIIDRYKHAISLIRELDAELEAITWSRIGMVYKNILNLNDKAVNSFREALKLADSLQNRDIAKEKWYKVSVNGLEKERCHRTHAERTEDWMKEKDKILSSLQPQIDRFKNIKDNYEFMLYVDNNHPPKDEKYKLKDDLPEPSKIDKEQIKKLLKRLNLNYHPNFNSKDWYGNEWDVLSEEISKELNRRYDSIQIPTSKEKK